MQAGRPEDPTITRFIPHVAATAQQPEAYVWAVDAARARLLVSPPMPTGDGLGGLPAGSFHPIGEPTPYAMVSTEPVEPLGPAEPVGDLLSLHETAGIQLRVLDNLWCFWDKVTTSTLGFSGIRLHNATPRP